MPHIDVQGHLRRRLIAELHLGRLKPGDRAPSLREVSAELGVGIRAVSRAYTALAQDGLVTIRGRSGVYVDTPSVDLRLTEPQAWYSAILTDAWQRRIPLPLLPELLQRFVSRRLRCTCVESTEDHMIAFCTELDQDFGLETVSIDVRAEGAATPEEIHQIADAIATTDFVVTTAFHAADVRGAAQFHRKPVVVVSVNETIVGRLEDRLRNGPVTLLAADERFLRRVEHYLVDSFAAHGRLRVAHAAEYRSRPEQFAGSEVLPTRAAQKYLSREEYHLFSDSIPFLSLDAAREITQCMIAVQGGVPALQPA